MGQMNFQRFGIIEVLIHIANMRIVGKDEKKVKQALKKIADDINKKRRDEILKAMTDTKHPVREYVAKMRRLRMFDKGSKSKVWRKIAEMPIEVDRFFTKMYGEDYYKDKDFFTKLYPEWRVIDVL